MAEIQEFLCKSQLDLQDSMKLIAQKEASLTTFLIYYPCAIFQEVLAPWINYYKSKAFEVCLFCSRWQSRFYNSGEVVDNQI